MEIEQKVKNVNPCIVINSTAYFIIAYYVVVFSHNFLSMILAKSLGFDVELFYYGFTHGGKDWVVSDVLYVFFYGNVLSFVLAIVFERLYNNQRRYTKGIKMFFLWMYLLSLIWFLGNIIIGAFFNFGIGAAIRAYHIPFFLRLIFAMVALYLLLFFGKRSQKHIRVSANLYFSRLQRRETGNFFLHQIVLPVILGLGIVILMKIPHLGMYRYIDLYLLFTIIFFIAGLFYRHGSNDAITFRNLEREKANMNEKSCKLMYVPLFIAVVILGVIRIGLMNGLSI